MSLKSRLVIAFAALLLSLSLVIAWVGRYATEMYFHEVHQSLNASIAMYVVERLTLIEDGSVNEEALQILADRAMTINPSVEVYLLDPRGQVLSHALGSGIEVDNDVALAPIERFLAGADQFPILGTDPMGQASKAFSVSPIMNGEQLAGYLYVVLGGQQFDAVKSDFLGSFILRMASGTLAVVFALGVVVAFLVVRRTTRPLEELRDEVQVYADEGFSNLNLNGVSGGVSEVSSLKTTLNLLADKLAEQFDQIEANDRLRRELFANVSHDLRTPLSSMQGYLETLLIKDDELATSERRQYVATAHLHTKRLNELVGDLFQLAKLDSGAVEINAEPFLVSELLQDVAQEFSLQARDRQIDLRVLDLPNPLNSMVFGDIALIQRVLENLISNALRHTPQGGVVSITIEQEESGLAVSVKDTGDGIDASLLPQIFDRFTTGSAAEGHSGLGLAIVKRILDLHGSKISVRSSPLDGTRFSFALPLGAAA